MGRTARLACAAVIALLGCARTGFDPGGFGARGTAIEVIEGSMLDGADGVVFERDEAGAQFGEVVACGDINGDEYGDVIFAAPYASPLGRPQAGSIFVVFGGASLDASLDLGAMDATGGIAIHGAVEEDRIGKSLAYAGNVLGDSTGDLIFCAINPDRSPDSTFAFVTRGRTDWRSTGGVVDLALSGVDLLISGSGTSVCSHYGRGVGGVGDSNGDGTADLLFAGGGVAAAGAGLVFGGASLPATIAPAFLNGLAGTWLSGTAGQLFGAAVGPAGDVDNDGFDDFIVGAMHEGDGHSGAAYLVFGRPNWSTSLDSTTLDGIDGVRLAGMAQGANVGSAVNTRPGDVNGDGYDDLLIGAMGEDRPGFPPLGDGRAYLVLGRSRADWADTGGAVDLSAPVGLTGVEFVGSAQSNAGRSVGVAGDVNGDGLDDFWIAAQYAGGAGRVYVLYGRSDWSWTQGRLDLASAVDGSNGFVIAGIEDGEKFGRSVDSCDVNNDGLGDLVIGSSQANPGGMIEAGRGYVVYGFEQSPQR